MSRFNLVALHGNLVRDPEIIDTDKAKVARIDLAVQEIGEDVSFVKCTAFNKQAEFAEKYLKKGGPIIVTGRLKQNKWQDKDGKNRSELVVNVTQFNFVGEARKQESEVEETEPVVEKLY